LPVLEGSIRSGDFPPCRFVVYRFFRTPFLPSHFPRKLPQVEFVAHGFPLLKQLHPRRLIQLAVGAYMLLSLPTPQMFFVARRQSLRQGGSNAPSFRGVVAVLPLYQWSRAVSPEVEILPPPVLKTFPPLRGRGPPMDVGLPCMTSQRLTPGCSGHPTHPLPCRLPRTLKFPRIVFPPLGEKPVLFSLAESFEETAILDGFFHFCARTQVSSVFLPVTCHTSSAFQLSGHSQRRLDLFFFFPYSRAVSVFEGGPSGLPSPSRLR